MATPAEERLSDDLAGVVERLVNEAAGFDRQGEVAPDLLDELGTSGYLGATVPDDFGGRGLDDLGYGQLCAVVGSACSSTRSIITVHNMVAQAILRWGDADQRAAWLPALASGRALAAFCLTEPEVGSDGAAVSTTIAEDDEGWRVSGTKLWVTGGRIADVFLVIGRNDGGPTAILMERTAPGVTVEPTSNVLGLRAAMLATVTFADARASREAMLARPGFGWSHVAATALDHGRFSVAWGCVGILRSCVDVAAGYAARRRQFGAPLSERQLIRRMIADMATDRDAADALARGAARSRRDHDPNAIHATMVAKYFASRAASRAAADAVQILGAVGTSDSYPVERHFRDAKIMQIIEGSDQMQQMTIADHVLRGAGT